MHRTNLQLDCQRCQTVFGNKIINSSLDQEQSAVKDILLGYYMYGKEKTKSKRSALVQLKLSVFRISFTSSPLKDRKLLTVSFVTSKKKNEFASTHVPV